jgi:hypothetical protein
MVDSKEEKNDSTVVDVLKYVWFRGSALEMLAMEEWEELEGSSYERDNSEVGLC